MPPNDRRGPYLDTVTGGPIAVTAEFAPTNEATMKFKRKAGIAGQFSITVTFRYHGDDEDTALTFTGSQYGDPGPVVMIQKGGAQTFVIDPGRFGTKFGEEWVRAFVGDMGESICCAEG